MEVKVSSVFFVFSAVPENPMCRICHDSGAQEELLSPCECSGTLATIHRSCLEHWLSASGTSFCELCHYQFTVQRKSRSLLEVQDGQESYSMAQIHFSITFDLQPDCATILFGVVVDAEPKSSSGEAYLVW